MTYCLCKEHETADGKRRAVFFKEHTEPIECGVHTAAAQNAWKQHGQVGVALRRGEPVGRLKHRAQHGPDAEAAGAEAAHTQRRRQLYTGPRQCHADGRADDRRVGHHVQSAGDDDQGAGGADNPHRLECGRH